VHRFGSRSAVSEGLKIAGPSVLTAVNAIVVTALETPRFSKIVSNDLDEKVSGMC